MEVHCMAHSEDVLDLVSKADCRLIAVDRQDQTHGYQDCHFWIAKK